MTNTADAKSARQTLLDNLPLIDQVTRSVCRRRGLSSDETEEVVAVIRLRLIEDDYAILRNYQARSSLATYIAVIVRRWLADDSVRRRGKWHESADAHRLGPLAVELERLLHRDHHSIEEALPRLRRLEPAVTRDHAERLAELLPSRAPLPRSVPIEEASFLTVPHHDVEPDHERVAENLAKEVRLAIEPLSLQDRLILRFVFSDGMTLSDVARALQLPQKPLYRKLNRILHELRSKLEAAGIRSTDVNDIIVEEGTLDFGLRKSSIRPSEETSASAGGGEDRDFVADTVTPTPLRSTTDPCPH